MILQLEKLEKLEIENAAIKLDNIQMAAEKLQVQFNHVKHEYDRKLEEFCSRNSKKVDDIVEVNSIKGTITFKDEKNEDKNNSTGTVLNKLDSIKTKRRV